MIDKRCPPYPLRPTNISPTRGKRPPHTYSTSRPSTTFLFDFGPEPNELPPAHAMQFATFWVCSDKLHEAIDHLDDLRRASGCEVSARQQRTMAKRVLHRRMPFRTPYSSAQSMPTISRS
jgi:hypothetical protein